MFHFALLFLLFWLDLLIYIEEKISNVRIGAGQVAYRGFIRAFSETYACCCWNKVNESCEREPKQSCGPWNKNNELKDAKTLCRAEGNCSVGR